MHKNNEFIPIGKIAGNILWRLRSIEVRKKLIGEWERRSVQKGQGLLLQHSIPAGFFIIVVTSKKMERNYFLEMAHSLHPFPPPHP
ncbi:MAG: hypothetical protein LBS09_05185 [Bacteroidales bacterium]|nr:hypothetical protein [Bacteroidales bacterium]